MSKNNQIFQRNILRYIALLFALLLCKDIRASDTPFANGNLTKDSNKGISSITYNCLNLPGKVTFSNGNSVTFTYAADGTKLKVVYVIGAATVTDYFCDNVIYEGGTQKYLLNEEGYYNLATSTYCYYLRDHQGNNRVVINSSGTVQETNHYYPFGGLFATTSTQPYKYNGKELMTKNGLAWYDYGARHYDPALGRFVTGDPMAEKYFSLSPYGYCANNPVRFVDRDGRKIVDANGNVMYTKETGWTEYATPQAIRIGEAMMLTRIGTTQFNKLVEAEHNITLNLYAEKLSEGSVRILGRAENTLDKIGNVLSANIKIYLGSINEMLSESDSYKARKYRPAIRSIDEAIGAVAVHESIHAEDKENIRQGFENTTLGTNHDVEEKPLKVEYDVLDELFNTNNKF